MSNCESPQRSFLNGSRRKFLGSVGAGAVTPFLLKGASAPESSSNRADYPDLFQLQAKHLNEGIISPEKTYRAMEWEFHTPPQERFDRLDVNAAAARARDAGAEALMIYSQDHWGYAFYPTDAGVRHPNLSYDLFGKEISAAKKHGLSVICYYSLQFNNQAILSHPQWSWVNAKGEQQSLRWHVACLDTPYRQYVLGMMNEIFSRYEVDMLMIDIFGIQTLLYNQTGRDPFCYCKFTEDSWNEQHPDEPYRTGFNTREGWERRYQWLEQRAMVDMLDEIIKISRTHRPNLLISLNGGPERFPDSIMQKVSFILTEVQSTPTGVCLGAIMMRGWNRPYYQGAIFSDQGYIDMYPATVSRVNVNALLLQNCRTFFVGNAPIINGLDGQGFSKRWFDVAAETWADVCKVDCLLGPRIQAVYSAAMLFSDSTRRSVNADKRPLDFKQSTLGALELMTYSGRPVESLPEFRLTNNTLESFDILLLPEVEVLSSAQAQVIRDWVAHGGTLIASYNCGLLDENRQARTNFPLNDVLGVDYVSEERKYAYNDEGHLRSGDFTSTYLESTGHRLAKILARSTVGLPGPFLRLKRTTAEEVMNYRLPFMVQNLDKNQWFNWGPPPPGSETAGTAVAYNRFGKGQSLYIGAPIFRAMQYRLHWIQKWIPEMIRQLVANPIIELRTDPFSEYLHGTFFYDEHKRFVLAQVLNTVELSTNGELRPAPDVTIAANFEKLPIKGARMVWPEQHDLTVTQRDGTAIVRLVNPARYTALFLKLT